MARSQRGVAISGGGVASSGTVVRTQVHPAGGEGEGRDGGGLRRAVVIPRPPHSLGAAPLSGLPPYTPQSEAGLTTPTPSEVSESTGVGVEDVTTSSQIGEPSDVCEFSIFLSVCVFRFRSV